MTFAMSAAGDRADHYDQAHRDPSLVWFNFQGRGDLQEALPMSASGWIVLQNSAGFDFGS